MVAYKEFEGKTLDDAIREACEYYGVAREKLEIDILSDAKSGIFGLVGAKKAAIRAGRVDLPGAVKALLKEDDPVDTRGDAPADAPKKKATARKQKPHTQKQEPCPQEHRAEQPAPAAQRAPAASVGPVDLADEEEPGDARGNRLDDTPGNTRDDARGNVRGGTRGNRQGGTRGNTRSGPPGDTRGNARGDTRGNARGDASGGLPDDTRDGPRAEELPDIDLAACDQDRLFALVKEVLLRLGSPIVGDVPCAVSIAGSRVRAVLDAGDASGLLVGREGQTLASVQYLASRIIARQIGGSVRLQVDTGDYRERQDDQIKELALSLALRVKEIGRPLSTRPLTAYQRRIVHLALEHDETVQTHSKGEGLQRRVTISLRSGPPPALPANGPAAQPAVKDGPAKRENDIDGQNGGQKRGQRAGQKRSQRGSQGGEQRARKPRARAAQPSETE